MSELENALRKRASELLSGGEVKRVAGWVKGEFIHDPSPATFENDEQLKNFVYNDYCGANLSKYLINESKKEGKTAVFLKPCDTYSFNELVKEHRVDREKIYVIGVECQGKLDNYKIEKLGVTGVTSESYSGDKAIFEGLSGKAEFNKGEVLLEKCLTCKGKKFMVKDEEIAFNEMPETSSDRFSKVAELENMTADERFAFWKGELSRCIRCNACRNVCPACTCVKCVFDNQQSGVAAKANDDEFEEQLYHIIRAFHVAGRCTDCGECSRVCPERIPLHLLNRKFIKDINALYGEFQAGETADGKTPLTSYTEKDAEPTEAVEKVGGKV